MLRNEGFEHISARIAYVVVCATRAEANAVNAWALGHRRHYIVARAATPAERKAALADPEAARAKVKSALKAP